MSPRTYLRRRIVVFGGFAVFLASALYLPLTLLAPLPAAHAVSAESAALANQEVDIQWPDFGSSAIGAVGFPGVLASHGPTTPRTIASITKIITSLVVLDAKPLTEGSGGPAITMTSADVALYHSFIARNGEVRPVWAGLTLSERQVLEVVLVASANNYAQTLAEWAFGSEQAFLNAAGDWLAAQGLDDTTLRDSTGMNPGNQSSTEDLVNLGKLALANPTISSIVSVSRVAIPHLGTIENTNKLLGRSGVIGIKTGTLDEAGACLLFASRFDVGEHTVTLVGVVLGGPDHPTLDVAIRSLLASAAKGFRIMTLVTAGESYFTYSTPWGQSASAVASRDESALVWAGTPVARQATARNVRSSTVGDRVGEVTITVGHTSVSAPLIIDSAVSDPGPWWRLTHPFG